MTRLIEANKGRLIQGTNKPLGQLVESIREKNQRLAEEQREAPDAAISRGTTNENPDMKDSCGCLPVLSLGEDATR